MKDATHYFGDMNGLLTTFTWEESVIIISYRNRFHWYTTTVEQVSHHMIALMKRFLYSAAHASLVALWLSLSLSFSYLFFLTGRLLNENQRLKQMENTCPSHKLIVLWPASCVNSWCTFYRATLINWWLIEREWSRLVRRFEKFKWPSFATTYDVVPVPL